MKNILKLQVIFLAVVGLFLASCQTEEGFTITENFVNLEVQSMERGGDMGFRGCFAIIYPVTVEFPDGTTAEANDKQELRTLVKDWIQANGLDDGKPNIAFPFDVELEDGNLFTVTSEDDLQAIKEECGGPNRPHHGYFKKCFDVVFPAAVEFPDGTTTEVTSKEELRQTIKDWKEANPDATERPTLVMPFDIQLEDGTIVTIETIEDLQAAKEECGPRPNGPKCFKLVFPVTVDFPDGTSAEAADRQALRTLIKDWKMANPDATEKPSLAFPFDVELVEDGTIVNITSEDDLQAVKDACD